jgi:hypothetical protein
LKSEAASLYGPRFFGAHSRASITAITSSADMIMARNTMAPISLGIWRLAARGGSVDMSWFWGSWFWGLVQLLFWLLVLFLFMGWVARKLGLRGTELSERELTEELAAQKRRNDALEKRLQKLEDDKRD